MSELLTTGQMIDRLKVGEIAVGEVDDYGIEVEVFKNETGHILFCDTEAFLETSAEMVDEVKWRIEPKYVSFEEAVKAWKQGKRIKWISPDRTHEKYIHTKNHDNPLTLYNLTFRDLIEGSWEIKE